MPCKCLRGPREASDRACLLAPRCNCAHQRAVPPAPQDLLASKRCMAGASDEDMAEEGQDAPPRAAHPPQPTTTAASPPAFLPASVLQSPHATTGYAPAASATASFTAEALGQPWHHHQPPPGGSPAPATPATTAHPSTAGTSPDDVPPTGSRRSSRAATPSRQHHSGGHAEGGGAEKVRGAEGWW